MAISEKKPGAVALESALKDLIETTFNRQMVRAFGTSAPAVELREMRKELARIERRLESLATRVGTARTSTRKSGSRRGPGRPPTHTVCTVPGCGNPHYAKGLCSRCYQRVRRAEALGLPVADVLGVEIELDESEKKAPARGRSKGAKKKSRRKAAGAKKASKKASKKTGRKKTASRRSTRR